ncbi:MAG: class I SAM-dependent methyltransferase [Acidobacteriota bacterium]
MGLYGKFVFPRLLDWGLGKPELNKYRRGALEDAAGETLEIGFGTGLNLPHYPASVKRLIAIDSEIMLPDRVASRIDASGFPVQTMQVDAQDRLPFEDGRFDTIVTTFVLCSITDPMVALEEMLRVLNPSGKYLFFEHGSALDAKVQRWQNWLTPANRIIGCGCHLNRAIDELIEKAGFEITQQHRFALPGAPRVMGELYRGAARRG